MTPEKPITDILETFRQKAHRNGQQICEYEPLITLQEMTEAHPREAVNAAVAEGFIDRYGAGYFLRRPGVNQLLRSNPQKNG